MMDPSNAYLVQLPGTLVLVHTLSVQNFTGGRICDMLMDIYMI